MKREAESFILFGVVFLWKRKQDHSPYLVISLWKRQQDHSASLEMPPFEKGSWMICLKDRVVSLCKKKAGSFNLSWLPLKKEAESLIFVGVTSLWKRRWNHSSLLEVPFFEQWRRKSKSLILIWVASLWNTMRQNHSCLPLKKEGGSGVNLRLFEKGNRIIHIYDLELSLLRWIFTCIRVCSMIQKRPKCSFYMNCFRTLNILDRFFIFLQGRQFLQHSFAFLHLNLVPSGKQSTLKGKNLLSKQILPFYSTPLFRRE